MKATLICRFCGDAMRERDLQTGNDLADMNGLYLAHLIESHWPELQQMRAWRLTQDMGPRTLTAWQRL